MSTSSVLQSLFKYKAWANDELFAELEKVDPEQYKEARHTSIRLLNHIYVVDRIFAAHLSGQRHPYAATNTPETPASDQLRVAVAECDLWYVDYVSNLKPKCFSESIEFEFTDGARGRMSREEMLVHVATHGNYHRGAVGRIMTQVSVPPPRDIFTVYLHSSDPQRRTGNH